MAALAPRAETTRPADCSHVIADITSGDVNLTTISRKPNFAAQRLELTNETAATLVAVLTAESAPATMTVRVPANQTRVVRIPITSITASGSGALNAIAYWWVGGSLAMNK